MIQMESVVQSGDNSGARSLKCIKVLGGSKRLSAGIGDLIVVSIREAMPNSRVKKGTVHKAVIIRTKKAITRKDGSVIRFDENAAVLVKDDKGPIGTRIFGPVAREIRDAGYIRVASLAPEVL